MPHSTYMRDRIGSATVTPSDPIEAGSLASFELCYTAGFFGIDDSGSLKIAQRFASDMERPQFDDPAAPGYVSVEASNGAVLSCHYDVKENIRPWGKTLYIKVVRGYLREGDTITVRFGDRRGGSPGIRVQTFCEETFELKVLADVFATYDYVELPDCPTLRIVPGSVERWRAVVPTLRSVGESFRFSLKAEDLWGNPTDRVNTPVEVTSTAPVSGLPRTIELTQAQPVAVLDDLRPEEEGDLVLDARTPDGTLLARSNPMHVTAPDRVEGRLRPFWADMHGQSEETIGTNSIRDYFRFARDRAFLDVVCHQGNDFQITREFWSDLQRAVEEFNEPGRLAVFPGYEWSGNTGLGGDHNVIFLNTGEQIHRSSHALVYDLSDADTDCHTSSELYEALAGREAFLYAHVGGRYADLTAAAARGFTPAVEVHSAWGTFEWLLHDAFALGLRPGIVADSDGHKGRPGASYPGAGSFGAYGGLTCFLAMELSREAIFDSLKRRHHYATTGARLHLDVAVTTAEGATGIMGDELETRDGECAVAVHALCGAPIERLDFFNGGRLIETVRPFGEQELGRRIRLLFEGAKYRGRGRETVWDGNVQLTENSVEAARPINFWNPDKKVTLRSKQEVSWQATTTGGFSAVELVLRQPASGTLRLDTPLVKCEVGVDRIGLDDYAFDAGGLGRRVRMYRLPDTNTASTLSVERTVQVAAGADNPLYVRLVLEDGHVAWSSPVYLTRTAG